MAEKKKAYRRFEELARRATAAPIPAEADTIGEGRLGQKFSRSV